jgi:hypothetical protein
MAKDGSEPQSPGQHALPYRSTIFKLVLMLMMIKMMIMMINNTNSPVLFVLLGMPLMFPTPSTGSFLLTSV